jgi:hypothetical protein
MKASIIMLTIIKTVLKSLYRTVFRFNRYVIDRNSNLRWIVRYPAEINRCVYKFYCLGNIWATF